MSEAFNPYRDWLGLSNVSERPTYYELLGISPQETDPQRIRKAADAALTRVRGHRPGSHARQWASLLDELQAAKECLTDPARKAAYDQSLRVNPATYAPRGAAGAGGASSATAGSAMYPPAAGGDPPPGASWSRPQPRSSESGLGASAGQAGGYDSSYSAPHHPAGGQPYAGYGQAPTPYTPGAPQYPAAQGPGSAPAAPYGSAGYGQGAAGGTWGGGYGQAPAAPHTPGYAADYHAAGYGPAPGAPGQVPQQPGWGAPGQGYAPAPAAPQYGYGGYPHGGYDAGGAPAYGAADPGYGGGSAPAGDWRSEQYGGGPGGAARSEPAGAAGRAAGGHDPMSPVSPFVAAGTGAAAGVPKLSPKRATDLTAPALGTKGRPGGNGAASSRSRMLPIVLGAVLGGVVVAAAVVMMAPGNNRGDGSAATAADDDEQIALGDSAGSGASDPRAPSAPPPPAGSLPAAPAGDAAAPPHDPAPTDPAPTPPAGGVETGHDPADPPTFQPGLPVHVPGTGVAPAPPTSGDPPPAADPPSGTAPAPSPADPGDVLFGEEEVEVDVTVIPGIEIPSIGPLPSPPATGDGPVAAPPTGPPAGPNLSPLPGVEPGGPPADVDLGPPSERELIALGQALTKARLALTERNFNESAAELAKAERTARLPEHVAKVQRLKLLAHYVEQFWQAVGDAIKEYKGGEEIPISGGNMAVVVDVQPGLLVVKYNGTIRRYTREDIPAGLAMAIAEQWLNPSADSTRLIKGAFLAVEPKAGAGRAKELWQQVQTARDEAQRLTQAVDDKYDLLRPGR